MAKKVDVTMVPVEQVKGLEWAEGQEKEDWVKANGEFLEQYMREHPDRMLLFWRVETVDGRPQVTMYFREKEGRSS